VIFLPIFPITGKALLYLKVGRLFPLVFLIRSYVAHRWNYKENAQLLGDKPVLLYFIHKGWLWIEAGSLQ